MKGIQETTEKSLNILRKINELIDNTCNEIRKTPSNYLNELVVLGILEVEVRRKDKLFINKRLLEIMKGI